MIWARMLAYITGTVDQELLLRNEYLAAENRILRAGRGQAGYYAGLVSQAASLAFSNRSSFLTLRVLLALVIALLVVMGHVLLQGSAQRSLSAARYSFLNSSS